MRVLRNWRGGGESEDGLPRPSKNERNGLGRPSSSFLTVLAILLLAFSSPLAALAKEPAKPLLAIDDLYSVDGPQSVVVSPDDSAAAYVRRWIDAEALAERFSLWLVEGDPDKARPLEADQPDARSPVFSPDGRWIAIRSTRARPQGWRQTPAAAPESEAATDIWLVSKDGRRSLPLSGPEKPYGRVFNDGFYGRVAFSPDGRRLAFVADDGRDPRTPEERAADVYVVRPDQGEGYTGYGTAQIWIAELDDEPADHAAKSVRRLTDDDIWYGDPQWSPDCRRLYCHANKSGDVEAVRHSINKNYDIWSIDAQSGEQRQLTTGPGAEVSPRVSPDGSRLICLSSPRKGPHADIFNLLIVSLGDPAATPTVRVLYDHHELEAKTAPHAVPAFPLPDECWDGDDAVWYTTFNRTKTDTVRVDLTSGQGAVVAGQPSGETASPLERRRAARQRLSPRSDPLSKRRALAEDRVVEWTNDGLALEGTITIPPHGAAPYPLVVYPHGGPHSRSTAGFNFTAQVLAAHGYLVFQPNFRGSSGYGRQFLDADRNDLGGGDMLDTLTGVESLVEQRLADPRRQFVYGVSYGGYMTCWLIGHTKQFCAAAAQNAVTDMNVMWGTSDIQSWTQWELGGRPWEIADAMRRHSPIAYVDQVTAPTLILHSRDDRRCPLPMGRMFHKSLLARGVPTEMVIYPNEGHGIRQPRHQADVLRRVVAWFAENDPGPAIPRVIPPAGIEISSAQKEDLQDGLDQLAARLKAAGGEIPGERRALLPDVEVLLKGPKFALAHGEFFSPGDVSAALEQLKLARERLDQLLAGKTPWTSAKKLVVRGYRSRIDDSLQPYGLVIPEALDLSRPCPLYVWLHGRGDKMTEVNFVQQRLNKPGELTPNDAIVLHPFGRYCNAFKFAGEIDVLEAIDAVAGQYPIDRDRIVLAGFSMGGAGAWHLGAHYAERWAAVSPGAGFAETRRYQRLTPDKYPPPYEQTLWGLYDAPDYVRTLFNVPVIAYSGEIDKQIQAARVMEETYQQEGRELTHLIGPGMGHKYHPDTLKDLRGRLQRLAEKGRERFPTEITLQTRTLRYPGYRWLTLLGLDRHWQDSRADAALGEPRRIALATKNVTALRVTVPWKGVERFPAETQITIDGQTVALPNEQPPPAELTLERSDGVWRYAATYPPAGELRKRPGLQGPIDDVFFEPFLVVTPSKKSRQAQVEQWVRRELAHFVDRWRRLFRGDVRIKRDDELTEDDIQKYHLIAWGDFTSNSLLSRVAGRLPLTWNGESLKLAGKTYDAAGHAPVMIYPNPLNPRRYLVLNSGPTFREAHDRTNSQQTPKLPDWAVIDLSQPPDGRQPGRIAAAGFFDEEWRIKE